MVFFRQCTKHGICKTLLIITGLPAQYNNCAFIDRQLGIRDHQIRIKFHLKSQAGTTWTCAKWIVE